MIPLKIKTLIDKYCMGVVPSDEQMDEITDMVVMLNADKAEVTAYMKEKIAGPTKEEVEAAAKAEAAKKAAEEEERRKAEEAKRKAEELQAKRKEEKESRKAEEAKRKAEEEALKKAKEAEEAAKKKAAAAKRKAEEEVRQRAEAKKRAELNAIKAKKEKRRKIVLLTATIIVGIIPWILCIIDSMGMLSDNSFIMRFLCGGSFAACSGVGIWLVILGDEKKSKAILFRCIFAGLAFLFIVITITHGTFSFPMLVVSLYTGLIATGLIGVCCRPSAIKF